MSLVARAEAEAGRPLPLDADARAALIAMADGDGRAIINLADEVLAAVAAGQPSLSRDALDQARAAPRAALRQGP